MDRASFTLRLPKATRSALEGLSKIERRPVNQLVNDAVDLYLRQSGDAEKDLVATLDALNKYRASDPGYSKAMAAFVEAEAAGAAEDSVEGTVVVDEGGTAAGSPQGSPAVTLNA